MDTNLIPALFLENSLWTVIGSSTHPTLYVGEGGSRKEGEEMASLLSRRLWVALWRLNPSHPSFLGFALFALEWPKAEQITAT